jgi:autophagy-related protein 5
LYVWSVNEDFDDLEDAPQVDSWDKISYINRPVEIHGEEGKPWLICRPPIRSV